MKTTCDFENKAFFLKKKKKFAFACKQNLSSIITDKGEFTGSLPLASFINLTIKSIQPRAPGWLSQLSIQIQLRSWSHSSWVQGLHRALCWQLRPWSLLQILCLPLSLCPSPTHALSFLPSKIKNIKKNFFKRMI